MVSNDSILDATKNSKQYDSFVLNQKRLLNSGIDVSKETLLVLNAVKKLNV